MNYIKKFNNLVMVLSILVVLNTPSVKVFYSSSLINFIGLMGVYLSSFLRLKSKNYKLTITKTKKSFITIFTLFIITIFMYGLIGPKASFSLKEIVQYLSIYFIVLGVLLFIESKDIKNILILQVIWTLIISISNYFDLITLKPELGQHYLTLGVPLAMGTIILAESILLNGNILKIKSIFKILILGFFIVNLLTLYGRAPILLTALVLILFFLILVKKTGFTIDNFKKIIVFSTLSYAIYLIFSRFVRGGWINRIWRALYSYQNEPRYRIYKDTINAIIDNPFGYGTSSFDSVIGGMYPHNILLEVTFYTGIFGLFIFLGLLFLWGNSIYKIVYENKETNQKLLVISMVSVYLFLTWNLSFELSSSYMPLTAMTIVVAGYDLEKHQKLEKGA